MIATILLGADGSDHGGRAMAFTTELAAQLGARVVVLHAFDPLDVLGKVKPPIDLAAIEAKTARALREDWVAPLRQAGIDVTTELVEGEPVPELASAVKRYGADMVVVGARGRNPFLELVLGSTAADLPGNTDRPVVIVP